MIDTKETFKRKGITFTKLYENNALMVYTCTRIHDNGETSNWFEIFKVKIQEADIFHDDQWKRYPNDEAFGTWAWSCSNIKSLEKVLKNKFPMEDNDEILQICRHV